MVVPFSRPDPSSAAAIAEASFGTSRRGYDPGEVRDFLRMVAAELARLQERERFLEREVIEARRPRAIDISDIDEDTFTAVLGEETARVLRTARESAAQIKARADEAADRLLREAQDEAAKHREQAELDAAHLRDATSRDATAELEVARREGRQMVEEARLYRERVIADLNKRRDASRQQLTQLSTGRDRIISAFDRARMAANDVIAEMQALGDEPDDLALPASATPPATPLRDHGVAQRATMEQVSPPSEARGDDDIDAVLNRSEVAELRPSDVDTTGTVASATVTSPEVAAGDDATAILPLPLDADPPAPDSIVDLKVDVPETVEPGTRDPDDGHLAPVVELFSSALAPQPVDTPEPNTAFAPATPAKRSIDDLFARLRSAPAAAVPEETTGDAGEVDAASNHHRRPSGSGDAVTTADINPSLTIDSGDPIATRDETLSPIVVEIARRLKRVLADEQNDVLDLLRQRDPVTSLDTMLPSTHDQVAEYAAATREPLHAAALAGTVTVSVDSEAHRVRRIADAGVIDAVVIAVTTDFVEPLREDLDHAVRTAGGDNVELASRTRGIYREWKHQRIDDLALDLACHGYRRGASAVIVPGTPVRWVIDPHASHCPDGDDSGGTTEPGRHVSCRCVVTLAR